MGSSNIGIKLANTSRTIFFKIVLKTIALEYRDGAFVFSDTILEHSDSQKVSSFDFMLINRAVGMKVTNNVNK